MRCVATTTGLDAHDWAMAWVLPLDADCSPDVDVDCSDVRWTWSPSPVNGVYADSIGDDAE